MEQEIPKMSLDEIDKAIFLLQQERRRMECEQANVIQATEEKLELYKRKREEERNLPITDKVCRYVKREWSFFLIKLSTVIQVLHLLTFLPYNPYSQEWYNCLQRHIAITLAISAAFMLIGLMERVSQKLEA